MTVHALTRREVLSRLAQVGVVLVAAPGMRLAWASPDLETKLGALSEIEGFATAATIHQGELLIAVATHDGPRLFSRNLAESSTWQPALVDSRAFPPGTYIRSLVTFRDRLIALGTHTIALDPVEFAIEDDQEYFNPEDPDIKPFPPGTVIREERSTIEPLLATTTDLKTWKVVQTGLEHASFAGGFTVRDRLVLIGEVFESPTFSADSIGAVVIASSDLTSWERWVLPDHVTPLHGHFSSVATVNANGGLVVVSDTRGTRLFETSDAQIWTESTLPGGQGLQVMGVVPVPGGVGVAAVDGDRNRAWVRNDRTWEELDLTTEGHVVGLASIGAELVLLGSDHDNTPLVVAAGGEA